MRKLTITILALISIIFAACASPSAPQVKDKRAQLMDLPRPKEKPDEILRLGKILSNGTRVNVSYEIYGPLPCDVAHELGLSCSPNEAPSKLKPTPAISPAQYHSPRPDFSQPGSERPRQLTPAERDDSVERKKPIGEG
jgi:hypothetical protein